MITCFLTDMISSPGGQPTNDDHCDSLGLDQGACWVLADGQGGGENSARLACDAILESFRAGPTVTQLGLERHLDAAKRLIAGQADFALLGKVPAVAVLVSNHSCAVCAQTGDTRLIHFRGGKGIVQSNSMNPLSIEAGDAFLLCSNGFWELLSELEMEIEYSKAKNPSEWLRGMESRLFRKIEAGGDNYSAVAVFAL